MGVVSNLENSNMAMLSCSVADGHVEQQAPTQWAFAASDANGRLLKYDKGQIDNTKFKRSQTSAFFFLQWWQAK